MPVYMSCPRCAVLSDQKCSPVLSALLNALASLLIQVAMSFHRERSKAAAELIGAGNRDDEEKSPD